LAPGGGNGAPAGVGKSHEAAGDWFLACCRLPVAFCCWFVAVGSLLLASGCLLIVVCSLPVADCYSLLAFGLLLIAIRQLQ
jgi:hypothetical protein